MAVPIPDRIKNNPRLSFAHETHPHGNLGGTNEQGHSGMLASFTVIDDMGTTGPSVPEFPSKSAGIAYGGDHDIIDPMD